MVEINYLGFRLKVSIRDLAKASVISGNPCIYKVRHCDIQQACKRSRFCFLRIQRFYGTVETKHWSM